MKNYFLGLKVLVCLAIFFVIYLSSSFSGDWLPVAVAAFVLALTLSSIWPAPGYHIHPESNVCSSDIEYFLFPSKNNPPAEVKVFFHGAGNDAVQ